MMPYSLLVSLIGCFLFQINDGSIIVPGLSSPAGFDASIQVKLLEEKLPGAVFSIVLKFETKSESILSQFNLEEKHKNEWELLAAGNASKTQTEGKTIQTIPFLLRAKKTGAIDIPTLKASALLDGKEATFIWENWLIPEKLFPFKELDTPQIKEALLIESNSPWLAIGLLLLIALGVLMLIKKPPVLITTELNIAKELETWLEKVETLSLEDSITTLEPLLQTELQKQADANASNELASSKFKELTQPQRLVFEKAVQALREIKYSKNKDRTTLIFTIKELVKTL
ncbi:MAG: hypothetical protein CK551_06630 [Planctomycetaceae bacterium]|nr:hypothetical protein [Gemmataceae bacterium]PHX63319.1 MAG: hypothetical protein CK551_06630 [Planctomycetaceae bacterium]